MAGVQNDYNQVEGDPRTRIGNWVEERALLSTTGQSRGSCVPHKNDTATRITGPVLSDRDYGTTTRLAHEHVLRAPHGPAFVESIAPPRRAGHREAERHQLAVHILEQQRAQAEAARDAEVRAAAYGHKGPQNRRRALEDSRPLSASVAANPLNGPAISFHTQHLGAIHGVTPKPVGAAATFGRSTAFSMPIEESFYDQDRR